MKKTKKIETKAIDQKNKEKGVKEIKIKIDLNLLIKILAILALLLLILVLIVFLLKDRSPKKEIMPNTNLQTQDKTISPSPTTKPAIKKSPSPTPKPTPPYSAKSEREEILEATKRYVESHSAPGQKFELSLTSKVTKGRNEYALVHVEPIPAGSAEGAGAVLQKIGGLWVVMDFGTLLMEWQEQVPELFNF